MGLNVVMRESSHLVNYIYLEFLSPVCPNIAEMQEGYIKEMSSLQPLYPMRQHLCEIY